jgi:hypothetical protein
MTAMAHQPAPNQPFHRAMTTTAIVAVLVAFTSGCSADQEPDLPNDRTWESAHFRYHTRYGDEGACEAILEQLERHFELMQAYLGLSWPKGYKVDYYKFRDTPDYLSNAGCPGESDSCSVESTVLSPHPLEDHELIHAYLAPLGIPPAFFVEGMASVLACRSMWTLGNPRPWREVVLLPFSDRFNVYAEGPWFMGYLLHHYGTEPLISLYDRLDHVAVSLDQISSAFESVYGETLDAAWNAALASSHRVRCVNLWQCSGATLALDGGRQTLAQACDGTDHTRTFQLDAETDVILSTDLQSVYAPVSCDQDLPFAVSGNQFGSVTDPAVAPMTPGRYFIQGSTHGAATVGIRALSSKAYSQSCAQTEAVDLSASEFSTAYFDLTIPNDGNSWYVKLHPPSNRSVWWGHLESSNEVEECLSCREPSACQPLEGVTPPDAYGNVMLRLTSSAPGEGYVTHGFLIQ